MAKYQIKLKNCAFFARHGVYNEEEVLGQRFFVDAVLDVKSNNDLQTDDIENTVDYGKAFKSIEAIVMGQRRYLIEALAMDIARKLTEEFPIIEKVSITVRKPSAPVPGVLDYVEVSLCWPQ